MDIDSIIDLTADDEEISDDEFQEFNPDNAQSACTVQYRYKKTAISDGASTSTSKRYENSLKVKNNSDNYSISSSDSDTENKIDPSDLEDRWLIDNYGDDQEWSPTVNSQSDDDCADKKLHSPVHRDNNSDSENDFDMQSSQTSVRTYHPVSESDISDTDINSFPSKKKNSSTQSVKITVPRKRSFTANKGESSNHKEKRIRRTTEEKQAAELAKQKRKMEREEARRKKPGECLKYLTMEADNSLIEIPILKGILDGPPLNQIQCNICSHIPYGVRWKRELTSVSQGNVQEEVCQQIIQVLDIAIVKEIIFGSGLTKHVADLIENLPETSRVAILILGSQQYFRAQSGKKKKKSNEQILYKSQLDESIVSCQIELKVTFRLVETAQDVNEWLYRYSKAVGEHPFKMNQRCWQDSFRFHLASEKGKNITIGSSAIQGLSHLWINILRKFRRATPEACQAIATAYPSPAALIAAYEACSNVSEARNLLQNIKVSPNEDLNLLDFHCRLNLPNNLKQDPAAVEAIGLQLLKFIDN